jgi:hypothetical protein
MTKQFDSPGVKDPSATLAYLKCQIDRSARNLLCYSENYGMTKPKDGYADEWQKAQQECELADELIQLFGGYEAAESAYALHSSKTPKRKKYTAVYTRQI